MKPEDKIKQDSNATKSIVILYHRDPSDSHRGQGRYLANLQRSLSMRYYTMIIGDDSGKFQKKFTPFGKILNSIIHSYFNIIKFFWHLLREGKYKNRILLIAEDVYVIPIALLLVKLFRVKLLYRASDFGRQYRESISKNFKASRLIYLCTRLIEHIAILHSDYIIVPSLALKQQLITSSTFINESNILYFPYTTKPKPPNLTVVDNFKITNKICGKFLLVFIGSADYPPNMKAIDAIICIANELENNYPEILFIIAGKGTERFRKSAPTNIMVLGEVDDLDTLLYSCKVGLTPVETPGGLSMKTVDYLVHGLIVICTPEGALGIPNNGQMIICKLNEFKHTILNLYDDFLNSRLDSLKVSKEVQECFISDRDELAFLNRMDNIVVDMFESSKPHTLRK